MKLDTTQISLRRRIIEMSYQEGVTHLGSALSSVDIIDSIYQIKRPSDRFVLSNGHAAAALYAVLESRGFIKKAKISDLGVHPEKNEKIGVSVSTGSLGQGLPIAVGMAIGSPKRLVYCCSSDGECAEGSMWEALHLMVNRTTTNLRLIINANGYSGYGTVDLRRLVLMIAATGLEVKEVDGHSISSLKMELTQNIKKPRVIVAHTSVDQLPFLSGLSAHYYKMSDKDFQTALKIWSKN